jgi:predicted Zn-dependent protease
MDLAGIDSSAVARALAQIADREDDLVEAFFERSEVVEALSSSGAREVEPAWRTTVESGFALRLRRGERSWLVSRDGLDGRSFAEAARRVARVQPRGAIIEPVLETGAPQAIEAPELDEFPRRVERAVRAHHAAFPVRFTVRRHRRAVQVVGARLVPAVERETFWSVRAETPWGRHGALFARLDDGAVASFASALWQRFRARDAPPPDDGRHDVVLGPDAAAVFLHEAVAHALEADTLAQGGNPGAAIGVRLAAACLDVLDDPAGAPEGVRRETDDEGSPVMRRWLLRGGVVEQPLADARWAERSAAMLPGAARRSSRHLPPGPRSHYLELIAREGTAVPLGDGFAFDYAERGALDPRSGMFTLDFPCGARLGNGAGEAVGACRLRGRLADLLGAVVAVGGEARLAGAGWCAKGGQKLPVWAHTPSIHLAGATLESR